MDAVYIVLGILFLVSYLVAIGIGIADYIMSSIALFRIARKRGASLPGLAWVPVVNEWTFGSVVDDFESQKGSKRKFSIILLILALVTVVFLFAFMVALSILIGMSFADDLLVGESVAIWTSFYATYLPFVYIAIVYWVLKIICLHKIHENIYPEKSIKYLVISILVPLGYSICLLKNSKRCEEKLSI